jgi:hypothetical protein
MGFTRSLPRCVPTGCCPSDESWSASRSCLREPITTQDFARGDARSPGSLNCKSKKRGQSIRPPPTRSPSAQEVTWMLLLPENLDDEQRSTVDKLCQLFPAIEMAKELALEFARIVRGRSADKFNEWLRSAARSQLGEFVSFARGLSEDFEAVSNMRMSLESAALSDSCLKGADAYLFKGCASTHSNTWSRPVG